MARVLFLHEVPYEFIGVMNLTSYARAAGHEVGLMVQLVEGKKFWDKVKAFKPDVVAFSTMAFVHSRTMPFAQEVKERLGVPIIVGGPYPTYEPEPALERSFIDAIVRGEGEETLVELLDAIDDGRPWREIPNVWTKENGEIIRNPVRPLIQDLDSLPFADRSIYYHYRYLKNITTKTFISGRGCPFDCYFCWIQEFHKLYGNKSKPVRRFSPEYMIEEIAHTKRNYPIKRIYFNDDIFIINKKWLQEFLPLYKEKIGLPFVCNVFLRLVDEDTVKLLKECGCNAVMFGIESGNERIRNEVLGKGLTEEQIYNGVALLKKHKIRTRSFNIIGSPTETVENAFETIEMNAKAKVDLPWCSIYQPHPGTKTTQIGIEAGIIPADFSIDTHFEGLSLFKDSVLDMENIKKLVRVQKLFNIGVWYPKTIPVLKKAVNLPLDPLFEILFLATFFRRYLQETDLSFWHGLQTAFYQFREYRNKPSKKTNHHLEVES